MARNKYNARKTQIDGITFDSLAEAARYHELKLLESAGEIANLECHRRFVIWRGTDPRSGKAMKIEYEPDFVYSEAGRTVAEDVKGGRATATRLYQLKAKMFRCEYPEIEFRQVER